MQTGLMNNLRVPYSQEPTGLVTFYNFFDEKRSLSMTVETFYWHVYDDVNALVKETLVSTEPEYENKWIFLCKFLAQIVLWKLSTRTRHRLRLMFCFDQFLEQQKCFQSILSYVGLLCLGLLPTDPYFFEIIHSIS